MAYKKWTESEINFLYESYGEIPVEDIAEELERSKRSVYHKIRRIGLSGFGITESRLLEAKHRREQMKEYIQHNNFYNKSHMIQQLAAKFKISKRTVYRDLKVIS